MTLAARFHAATTRALEDEVGAADLLPTLLSRAAVDAVGVDGAGISMTGELRVPLGASDPVVARAERLQITLGEGPCLSAAAAGEPATADEPVMRARWPRFTQELRAQTPYRSVLSVPLHVEARPVGALDLYSAGQRGFEQDLVEEVCAHVAGPIAALIFGAAPAGPEVFSPPLWLASDRVIERMNVWVAVGLVLEQLSLDTVSALDVLRAHAVKQRRSLDELADDVVRGRLRPEQVLEPERTTP